MAKGPSDKSPSDHSRQRVVLLAFRGGIEAIKRGIYDQARRAGWRIRDLSYFSMRIPRPCQADGALFLLSDQFAPARRLLRLGVPVVQIGDFVLTKRCCRVVSDQRAMGMTPRQYRLTRIARQGQGREGEQAGNAETPGRE